MSKARELANLRGTPTDSNILLQSTAGDALTAGSGKCNIAMGINALGATTIGVCNIAIGVGAMYGVTTGQADSNIAIGVSALVGAAGTTGNDNIAIGRTALDALTPPTAINNSSLNGPRTVLK